MGLYQRRRPSPIQIPPTRVRRQDATQSQSPKSPESSGLPSPESSGLPSPDSPKSSQSASASSSSVSITSLPPPTQTAAPPQVSSQATTTAAAQSTSASALPPPPPPPPPPPSSSTAQEQPQPSSSSSAAQSSASAAPISTPVQSSATQDSTSTAKESTSSSRTVSSTAVALPVVSSDAISTSQSSTLPLTTGSAASPTGKPVSSPSNQTASSSPSSSFKPSTTRSTFVPAQSELEGENSGIGRHRTEHHEGPIISKGAEAAAITLSIMGFIALIVGIAFFLRRRRRRRNEYSMRHAEDAFSPNNNGSLHAPETAHIGYDGPPPSLAHMTKSSTSSTELFAGAHYERPETVSTKWNSRVRAAPSIAPPQPTPNPFADPPRNKAYDQLRGRPRSTTLTDRGSWMGNPFKDPASERFDPFGELQEKARAERRKYVEEARREAEDRMRREDEQDYLEKERSGLRVPKRDERKGSDVTVGGIGVLDRSGDGRWP